MREVYQIDGTRAVVLLEQSVGGDWFVQSVYVPPSLRSQGYGTRLLARVCADADIERVTLVLAVQPQGGRRSLVYGELVRWYGRHGFVPDYDNLMMRRPKTGGNDVDLCGDGGERERAGQALRHQARR